MYERHEHEQYFFDQATIDVVAGLLEGFERPGVLCAPLVGTELEDRGLPVTTLDIDERFATLRGFRRWDAARPRRLDVRFDVIFCDPPFFRLSLSQLFRALRMLAGYDFAQPLAVTGLVRRRTALLGTFAPFGLRSSGWRMGYRTVQPGRRNEIELFVNFELRTPSRPDWDPERAEQDACDGH